MKLLIIASDIGITVPGIVYETIIKQLEKEFDIDIITPEVSSKFKPTNTTILPSQPKGFTHLRAEKLSFQMFSRNVIDDYWVIKQMRLIKEVVIKEYDAIISFISFHNYRSLMLGYRLSKKYVKPWLVYSVDAVPPPSGWEKDDSYRKNIIKFVKSYLEKATAFFSSNEQMLEYQLGLLNKEPETTGVLYTPIKPIRDYVRSPKVNETPVFLYTGGLYGPRKKDTVLNGFRLLLESVPKAKIIFVGVSKFEKFVDYQELIDNGSLEYYDFKSDLAEFYKRATVLLDINAYFDNDVFLSSKIVNYLPLMLPIISVTGFNSPARNIFKEDVSIIHCKHNAKEVCEAMKRAIGLSVKINERQKYIEMFSVENILHNLTKALNTL